LVVEDNSHVRDPLVQILAAIGHTPLEATDAASALAHFAGVAPDLVITDLAMPGMNGIDLAAAIRATHPQTPVILHTGWQDEPTLDAELERGTITAVLEKPIDIRKLSAVIDQYGPTS
jgi:CheY-like chemotaxis protein